MKTLCLFIVSVLFTTMTFASNTPPNIYFAAENLTSTSFSLQAGSTDFDITENMTRVIDMPSLQSACGLSANCTTILEVRNDNGSLQPLLDTNEEPVQIKFDDMGVPTLSSVIGFNNNTHYSLQIVNGIQLIITDQL